MIAAYDHKHDAVKAKHGAEDGIELRLAGDLHGWVGGDGEWWAWRCRRCPAIGSGHAHQPGAWAAFRDHEKATHDA